MSVTTLDDPQGYEFPYGFKELLSNNDIELVDFVIGYSDPTGAKRHLLDLHLDLELGKKIIALLGAEIGYHLVYENALFSNLTALESATLSGDYIPSDKDPLSVKFRKDDKWSITNTAEYVKGGWFGGTGGYKVTKAYSFDQLEDEDYLTPGKNSILIITNTSIKLTVDDFIDEIHRVIKAAVLVLPDSTLYPDVTDVVPPNPLPIEAKKEIELVAQSAAAGEPFPDTDLPIAIENAIKEQVDAAASGAPPPPLSASIPPAVKQEVQTAAALATGSIPPPPPPPPPPLLKNITQRTDSEPYNRPISTSWSAPTVTWTPPSREVTYFDEPRITRKRSYGRKSSTRRRSTGRKRSASRRKTTSRRRASSSRRRSTKRRSSGRRRH